MLGAACALLSFKDMTVLFNSPRWCAVLGETELCYANKAYEKRLFCTEAEQKHLVFGIEDALLSTIDEIKAEMEPSCIAVLTSCSLSLIGDDIEAICKERTGKYLILETGGLTGEFAQGYVTAMQALVAQSHSSRKPKAKRVNLLGISALEPHYEGNLKELVRLLQCCGYEVGLCLGREENSLEDLDSLPEACLNVVLDTKLGEAIAEQLQKKYNQPYILNPWPIGISGTLAWLKKIAEAIGEAFSLPLELKLEIEKMQEQVQEQASYISSNFTNLFPGKLILSSPSELGLSFKEALDTCGVELLRFGKCQYLNQAFVNVIVPNLENIEPYRIADKLEAGEYQLFLGTEKEKSWVRPWDNTLYFNCFPPTDFIRPSDFAYVGLKGWACFTYIIWQQLSLLAHREVW